MQQIEKDISSSHYMIFQEDNTYLVNDLNRLSGKYGLEAPSEIKDNKELREQFKRLERHILQDYFNFNTYYNHRILNRFHINDVIDYLYSEDTVCLTYIIDGVYTSYKIYMEDARKTIKYEGKGLYGVWTELN